MQYNRYWQRYVSDMDRYDTCASDNKCYMYKDIDHAPSKHFGSIRCKIHNYEIKYYLYPMSLEKTVHTGDNILIKIMPNGSANTKKAAILYSPIILHTMPHR